MKTIVILLVLGIILPAIVLAGDYSTQCPTSGGYWTGCRQVKSRAPACFSGYDEVTYVNCPNLGWNYYDVLCCPNRMSPFDHIGKDHPGRRW